ncbi:putative E3 ubiquitin-protein ligase dtx2 [Halocaridina rubra]|uniref:E3 ubiquitin-protein ligase n=1 Tax=Halocaridina rubra TaxID=373956 RepID=A0AAN8XGD7_HALRR
MGQRASVYQTTVNSASIFQDGHTEIFTMPGPQGNRVVIRSMKAGRSKALAKELDTKSNDDVPCLPPDQLISKYTKTVPSTSDECSICMCSLQETSGFCDDDDDAEGTKVIELVLCSHKYHLACVKQMINTSSFLECPICKTVHGIRTGNQPDGVMDITEIEDSLPGHPDCGTIIITYFFANGTQGPDHPEPGQLYRAYAFPRQAFLPNNTKGKKVLKLLHEAWKRRLIFTIGTSVTTGMKNVITWNEIHHKTSIENLNGHGYPDPSYLDNVMMELALQGVTEDSIL